MVLAMLMTCIAIPVGGMLYSWIKSLTHLDSQKIVLPDWDFGPEKELVRIISDEEWTMMMTDRPRPYDWAREPYDWAQEID
jgi:hypothetical protein